MAASGQNQKALEKLCHMMHERLVVLERQKLGVNPFGDHVGTPRLFVMDVTIMDSKKDIYLCESEGEKIGELGRAEVKKLDKDSIDYWFLKIFLEKTEGIRNCSQAEFFRMIEGEENRTFFVDVNKNDASMYFIDIEASDSRQKLSIAARAKYNPPTGSGLFRVTCECDIYKGNRNLYYERLEGSRTAVRGFVAQEHNGEKSIIYKTEHTLIPIPGWNKNGLPETRWVKQADGKPWHSPAAI
jgi:hypothetical protein